MVDPEELITLRAAALIVIGKNLPHVTVSRWALKGVRGTKLSYQWVGGRRMTTVKSMKKFLAEVEAGGLSNGKK